MPKCGPIQFARNSWLADIEFSPENLDLSLIMVFYTQYQVLDNEFYKFKPSDFKDKRFWLMSRKLDERTKA